MSTTGRHAHPPAPPAVRDPLVRGPFVLELVMTLLFTLGPIAASGRTVYRWVYLPDNTPPAVILGLAGVAVVTLLGHAVLGWATGVRAAAVLAAAGVRVELAARAAARQVRTRVRTADDRGAGTPLLVATLVIALAIIAAIVALLILLFGSLDDAGWRAAADRCLAGCTAPAPVYAGTTVPAAAP